MSMPICFNKKKKLIAIIGGLLLIQETLKPGAGLAFLKLASGGGRKHTRLVIRLSNCHQNTQMLSVTAPGPKANWETIAKRMLIMQQQFVLIPSRIMPTTLAAYCFGTRSSMPNPLPICLKQ